MRKIHRSSFNDSLPDCSLDCGEPVAGWLFLKIPFLVLHFFSLVSLNSRIHVNVQLKKSVDVKQCEGWTFCDSTKVAGLKRRLRNLAERIMFLTTSMYFDYIEYIDFDYIHWLHRCTLDSLCCKTPRTRTMIRPAHQLPTPVSPRLYNTPI